MSALGWKADINGAPRKSLFIAISGHQRHGNQWCQFCARLGSRESPSIRYGMGVCAYCRQPWTRTVARSSYLPKTSNAQAFTHSTEGLRPHLSLPIFPTQSTHCSDSGASPQIATPNSIIQDAISKIMEKC